MKKQLLLLFMILLPMVASADAVEINGIYYNLIAEGHTAEVTRNPNIYSGDIVIPPSVSYQGSDYSVTSIGEQAFNYCTGLTSVTIPNSVTSIGGYAFAWCSSLTSITIGNGVTSIGYSAFAWCSSLTSITIGNGVTSIGYGAFSGCSGLTSVTIPNSVTSIGDEAFFNCYGLTSITIGNSVTSIGNSAFQDCSSLTSVTFLCKEVGSWFSGLKSIKEIVIGNGVNIVESSAFFGCSGLNSIVVEEGNSVYDSRENCNAIIETSTNKLIWGCINSTIPNSVTSIGDSAFLGCSGLISITIPNSVTSIGNDAFKGCLNLSSVTIPNSVISIGNNAFFNCKGLTSLNIPNSVISIGNSAFLNCKGMVSLTIGKSVTSIGSQAFKYCEGLTSVVIPNNVISIGEKAFCGCSALTSVSIGSSVTSIDSQAFNNCTELTSITSLNTTPPNVKSSVFHETTQKNATLNVPYGCKNVYGQNSYWKKFENIVEISSPDTQYSLTYMVDGEVYKTYKLKEGEAITAEPAPTKEGYKFSGWSEIPATMPAHDVIVTGTFVKKNANHAYDFEINGIYYNITSEKTVEVTFIEDNPYSTPVDTYSGDVVILPQINYNNVHYDVTSIGDSAFCQCTGLMSVKIPYSVTSIGYFAFRGCSGLTSLEIPNSVTSIGVHAFESCTSLTSVTIGNSVASIGDRTFYGCSSLTSIISLNTSPPNIESSTTFDETTTKNATLNIPSGCKILYEQNAYWKKFENIVEISSPDTQYTLTYMVDGDVYKTYKLKEGEAITIEPAPTKEGYNFRRWSEIPIMMPAHDVTIIGIFIPNGNTSSDKGKCGDNVDYVFYQSTGTLIISGSGPMYSFNFNNLPPWVYSSQSKLKTVVIEDGVTIIGSLSFPNCKKLTSVDIPNSVTIIDDNAFLSCSNLSYLNIPSSVTRIGYRAFAYSGLISVFIPDGVISIDEEAFADCKNLSFLNISSSVETIGNYAFVDCFSMPSSIIVNAKNNKYDSREDCNAIIETSSNTLIVGSSSATIPNSVTSIGNGAFSGCSGLTSIIIPNSVTSIGIGAFYNCSGLSFITIPNSVTSIGNNAFYGCGSLASVSIHCNEVGSWFNNNKAIKEVVLGNGVSTIGNDAFKGCLNLSSLTISNSVITIGESAFYNCNGLTSVTIPNSVISIGENAFSLCLGLASITIPNSVTSIGSGAFESCRSLISVTIPNKLTSISDNTFNGCTCLTSTIIPNSVISIGENAFYNCKGLTSLNIPNSVISIGESAFGLCSGLTTITIPNSVTSVGKYAFSGCTGLSSLAINSKNVNSWFKGNGSIKEVVLGDSVRSIADNAFSYCSGLTNVTIGNSVISIGNNAFSDCKSLASITSLNTSPPDIESSTTFDETTEENATLNVPYGCKNTYGQYPYWKRFAKIVEISSPDTQYSLTYMVDGEVYKTYKLKEGETISAEPAPTKEGYSFSGWSETPATMPAHDVTITGAFTINKYKLIYKVDGVEYKCYEVEYDASITPEPAPTKEGYVFSGWSYVPSKMPAEDVTVTGTFTIEDPVTVTAKSYSRQYGEANPTFEYTTSGATLSGTPAISCEATATSPVGEYDIVVSKGSVTNYNVNFVNGKLTVTKAPLTITAKSYTIMQGNAMPSFEVEYDGFKNGETSSVLSTQPVITTTATDTKTPGTYEIIVASASATNYDVSFVNGILIIEPINIDPVDETETTTFSEEVNENTDLSNTIIDNTYYTMNAENGDGYDATEQAIVLNSTTTAEQMDAVQNAEVGDATMQENYNGIIFEVPAGNGMITVEAKTIGSHILNVKIGNAEPNKIVKSERGTADVPYNVAAPTYVYLYASTSGANGAPKRAAAANSVLLYSYKVTVIVNGIQVVTYSDLENAKWYTIDGRQLPSKPTKKGLYIVNGRKVVVK